MSEGREGGEMMKIMYPKNTKNDVASGKSAFNMTKFQNIQRFQVKNGANCETPFPVFCKCCRKNCHLGSN